MKFKKLLGWALLIAGLAIVFTPLYFSYSFFTQKTEPPEIFKTEENQELPAPSGSSEDFQEEMKKMIEEQFQNMIPAEFTAKLFNLISWSIFAGLLIFGGSRISGIGIKLIRREM